MPICTFQVDDRPVQVKGKMMAVRNTAGLLKAVVQGSNSRALSAVASWRAPTPSKKERMETWDYVNSIYFGPERDMKNFPTPVQAKEHDPVRLGLLPATWFDFFAAKTGVSGGYVFFGGLGLWAMSKEVIVIDHDFWSIPGFWGMIYVLHKHPFGKKMSAWLTAKGDELDYIQHHRTWESMRKSEEDNLVNLERILEECQTSDLVIQTKIEGVELQLEAAYRQRLLTAYQEVKKRLDYEVDRENTKRKFEQDHMVDWIVSSVKKSITPQQEKESIKVCIATLKSLAVKQNTATA